MSFGPGGPGTADLGGVPSTVGFPVVRSFSPAPFPSPATPTQTLQGAFLYIDTNGATTNSGSTDSNTATYTGTAATASGTVVTLDGSPDLSIIATSGPTQQSILLQQATNSNRKIFWIVGVDNIAKTVTVDVAPTGITTGSWAIGGRHVLTNASIEGALRAGDTAIFNNSPAAQSTSFWIFRNSGDSTNGYAKIMGKTGVRPVLSVTGGSRVINANGVNSVWIENFSCIQTVSTGSTGFDLGTGNNVVALNIQVTAISSGSAMNIASTGAKVINCYVTNSAGEGFLITPTLSLVMGCYATSCQGAGIEISGTIPNISLVNCISASNAGQGIYFSGSPSNQGHLAQIYGCTIYGNTRSGIEAKSAALNVSLLNNIVHSNGSAGGYNVSWDAGNAQLVSLHAWNDFYQGSATAGGNLLNFSTNAQVAASEIVTDPLLVNPASGDFRLRTTSPAFNAGFPGALPNTTAPGGTSYLDLGALQRNAGGARRTD